MNDEKPKGIRYQPCTENRVFLKTLQKIFVDKGHSKKGLSKWIDEIMSDYRNKYFRKPFEG